PAMAGRSVWGEGGRWAESRGGRRLGNGVIRARSGGLVGARMIHARPRHTPATRVSAGKIVCNRNSRVKREAGVIDGQFRRPSAWPAAGHRLAWSEVVLPGAQGGEALGGVGLAADAAFGE